MKPPVSGMNDRETRFWTGGRLSIKQFFDATFLRFLLVGLTNFIISYSVFWLFLRLLHEVPGRGFISQFISYTVGIFWSFFWNRKITFKSGGPVLRQAWRFITLQISLAVSSSLLVGFGVDRLDFNPSLTWLVVMSFITAANFLLSKWWVFEWQREVQQKD